MLIECCKSAKLLLFLIVIGLVIPLKRTKIWIMSGDSDRGVGSWISVFDGMSSFSEKLTK